MSQLFFYTCFSNDLLESCDFIILQFMRTKNFPYLLLNNHKISLQNIKNKKDLSIDQDLINKAINRSYLKKMFGSDTLKAEEVINTVANFALSFIPQIDVQKQLQEFWCIVALNQAILKTEQQSCSCISGSNMVNFDLNNLKLYQLFIGLGSKELRFQSLQSSKGYFVMNMDTVQTQLVSSDTSDKSTQNHIRLVIEDKYNIDFFFTRSTLPIGLRQNISDQNCRKICSDYAKHAEAIIRNAILESKGKQYNLKSLQLPDSDFYKHLYATEQQFTRYTQTGDIILFKDNHTMAKVQRFLTNSQCDHIGIVFKDQKYGLCIFESNSGTGVSLALWNQLVRYKWFESIEGIFWRRLNMQNRPDDFQDRIREFVKANLHKQYGLSLGKLLSFNQTVYNNPGEQKNRTYFCSQLVAALYKHLGILQAEKPSSTYLPKDFTDKGSLNMINNTALEAQRRIIFNMRILKQSYKFYK